jgi:hypothetical protein
VKLNYVVLESLHWNTFIQGVFEGCDISTTFNITLYNLFMNLSQISVM